MKFRILSEKQDEMIRIISRMKKNVAGITFSISEPYKQRFIECVQFENGQTKNYFIQDVCDVEVEFPTCNDWYIVCSYIDGIFMVADNSKQVEFSNPAHGADYHKCDVCGREINNSIVIRNSKTNEELQCGTTCASYYAGEMIATIAKYHQDLISYIKIYGSDCDSEIWGGSHRSENWKQALEVREFIKSAKVAFDKNSEYQKGNWCNGRYQKSATMVDMLSCYGNTEVSDDYVNAVTEHVNSLDDTTDFVVDMKEQINNYYATENEARYFFFAVKSYEDAIRISSRKQITVNEGDFIEVAGKVIKCDAMMTNFGKSYKTIIRTVNDYDVVKWYQQPIEVNTEVHLYSKAKYVNERIISIGRELKFNKKNTYIQV